MGRSGSGVVAILITLLAVALSIISLGSPGWLTTTTVDKSWEGKVKRVETAIGLWGICIDVDLNNEGNLIRNNETAAGFSLKDCYAYYVPMTKSIVRVETIMKKDVYDSSICDHYQSNSERAYNAMGAMTGVNAHSIDKFLDATCSTKGKIALGLAVSSTVINFISLLILLASVLCFKNSVGLVAVCRYLLTIGIICSVVMPFLMFAQFRIVFIQSVGVKYGLPLYLDFAALFVVCLAVCTIESYEMHIKKANNKQETDEKLEAKMKEQNLISKRHQADVV